MPGQVPAADFLTDYDLVLTPTLRSARQLEAAPPHEQAPQVLAWNAWTTSLWQELVLTGVEDRVLLNEAQTASVWEQVLANSGPAFLKPVRSIVTLCMSAHRLLCDYGALGRLLNYSGEVESDSGASAMWLQVFERRCRDERWIAPAELERHAAKALRSGALNAYRGQRLLLYGFDRLLPAQEELLAALEAAGVSVSRMPACAPCLAGEETSAMLAECADMEAEFHHVALSLRAHLERGVRTVSVILPRASEMRGKLERELRSCLSQQDRPLWEFSEGVPLGSVPLVRDALALLHWLVAPKQPEAISQVLRSPYVPLGIELETAGELDAKLLRDGRRIQPEWSMSALARSLEKRTPQLSSALHALQALAPASFATTTYASWIETIQEILKTAGWPGTRERTSTEYQAVDRWNDLQDQLISLDAVSQPLTFVAFLRELDQLASATLFTPQNTGAPIQIMSPSECEGTTAESLFFLCAAEDQWNGRRSSHALLAFALQKEFGMPGTDPVHDDAETFAITQRILRSASEAHFSYSLASEETAMRPSTLVTRLDGLQREVVGGTDTQRPQTELDTIVDDGPLPELPDSTVSGGVSLLQSQAACAFRAFAERRLFSSELNRVDLGMDPRERGSLLHKALQKFWNAVRTRANLLRHLQAETLDEEIRRAVACAMPETSFPERWTVAYLDIQRERLTRLMHAWLRYEAERPPFEVLHTEHEIAGVQVGPLRMNMRVDRIDQVDDEGQPATVLIDYKTGNPDAKGWLGERPAEPQLPLYAVAAGFENVQAIAFATVKPGKKNLGLKTFPAKSRLVYEGAKEKDELAFESQLPVWRDTLESLARDFFDGRAEVGPKEYPATCQWCAQRMLCRLNPETLDELAEEDEDVEVGP